MYTAVSSECIVVHAPHQSWYNMGNFWLNESNSEPPFCTGFLQCCTVKAAVVVAAAHRPAAS